VDVRSAELLEENSMRVVARAASLVALILPVVAGCAGSSYAVKNQNQTLQQQQVVLQQRNQELQSRAQTLDQDNQEIEALLAQTRQHSKLIEDQLAAVRDQLSSATTQLSQLREEKLHSEKQTEAMMASTRRRAGATITANNSLNQTLPSINLPGVDVRPDGDVVRVELPSTQLFQSGSSNLQPSASQMLDTVGAELARIYPEQIIGIEGHTESDTSGGSGWSTNQQLSVNRAQAVFQQLATRGPLKPSQLFVVGHGGNHPVVSNATPTGRDRNHRVELVVYPEKVQH
jgi:flagellar motor protein MotB